MLRIFFAGMVLIGLSAFFSGPCTTVSAQSSPECESKAFLDLCTLLPGDVGRVGVCNLLQECAPVGCDPGIQCGTTKNSCGGRKKLFQQFDPATGQCTCGSGKEVWDPCSTPRYISDGDRVYAADRTDAYFEAKSLSNATEGNNRIPLFKTIHSMAYFECRIAITGEE